MTEGYTQPDLFSNPTGDKMPARYTYVLGGSGDTSPTTLRLRRWSISKYALFTKEIGEVIKEVGNYLDPGESGALKWEQIANLIIELGDQTLSRVVRMVRESIEDPVLEDAEIMEWMPEDFVGVLTKVCEINLPEELEKNWQGLKTVILGRFKKVPAMTVGKKSKT